MWGFCCSDNEVFNRISTALTSNSYSSNTLRRLSGTISFKPIQSRKKLVNGSKVKCIDGPFAGIVGEVINLDYNGRLKVLFQVIENYRTVSLEPSKVDLV